MRVELLRYTQNGIELVARSARVSGIPEGISDREIVRMIVEIDYSSALEHITFTFIIEGMSVALSRELLEHRIASHTARSTRYNEEADFGYYVPVELAGDEEALRRYNEAMGYLNSAVKELRARGVPREATRYLLPMATHTSYIWTINARSLINFLGLRLCVRAAPEIRALAMEVQRVAAGVYPEIFDGMGCRGYNLGLCPENEVRAGTKCPWKGKIPTKVEVKARWKND